MSEPKPSIDIIFKKGRPVAAFLQLRSGVGGRSHRTVPLRATITAHYDAAGLPVGLELALPWEGSLAELNDALREVGGGVFEASDLVALRA
jgi:hypothetical protein